MRSQPRDAVYLEDLSGPRRFVVRARRTLHRGRTWGWGNVIEQHDLDLPHRLRRSVRKWRWRRSAKVELGTAVPVYLVGVQRSGTNMIVRGLGEAGEFETYNEGDSRAFDFFRLREDDTIRRLIEQSRHRYVLFKPLCDSHRVDHLLDGIGAGGPARAVWAYRSPDGRIRSSLAHFGTTNLQVLRDFVAGRAADRWQVQRMSDDARALVTSLDMEAMSPASGAALFWYVRNSLFFDLGLDERDDVFLVAYESFLAEPTRTMVSLCRFLGLAYRPEFVAHVGEREPAWPDPLDIDPVVRAHCDALVQRLDETAARQLQRTVP
jgi:hypothetical protein